MSDFKGKTDMTVKYRATFSKSIYQLLSNLLLYLFLYVTSVTYIFHYPIISSVLIVCLAFIIVRLFIIQHDCAHGSYWPSSKFNQLLGRFLGGITHVPHYYWSIKHAKHHATSGNLDRRGVGDIWLLTVAEYQLLSSTSKLLYRFYRNPLILILFGSFFQGFIWFKCPFIVSSKEHKSRHSILETILFIALRVSFWTLFFDGASVFLVEFISMWIAAMIGIVLFYVQHNYDGVYWSRQNYWHFEEAAWKGSSYLDFGPIGHWLTGNIGYHHIHHYDSKVPNYFLPLVERLLGVNPDVIRLYWSDILSTFRVKLWDEDQQKMVTFRH